MEKNQKNLDNRITKLTEICRDRFKKVEKEYNAKFREHDEEVLNRIKEQNKLTDTIAVLEAEHDVIADRIKVIDETLELLNTNIDELKNNPIVNDVKDVKEENENDKKQCCFDNQGYCREKNFIRQIMFVLFTS